MSLGFLSSWQTLIVTVSLIAPEPSSAVSRSTYRPIVVRTAGLVGEVTSLNVTAPTVGCSSTAHEIERLLPEGNPSSVTNPSKVICAPPEAGFMTDRFLPASTTGG